jgi:hypothetical protein
MPGIYHDHRETIAPRAWRNVDEIRRAHDGHWFDADTMRFFSTRLGSDVIGGRYFITSERNETPGYPSGPRRYTIREAFADASIDTVGDFQEYATRKQAERAARELPTDYSASLMAVLDPDGIHNRTGWIRTATQLARYTGRPLEDCRAVIVARAKQRRRDRARSSRA